MSTTPPPPGAPPPPPPGGPPPPGPAPAGGSGVSLAPAQLVALLGGALVLISGWLDWFDFDGGDSGSAYRVPAGLLVDNTIQDDAGVSTGVLVFVAAALVVLGALLAQVRWLAIVGGAGGVLLGGLYLFQINGLVNDANDAGADISLFDFTTYFPILTIVGGIVAVIGGIMSLQQSSA